MAVVAAANIVAVVVVVAVAGIAVAVPVVAVRCCSAAQNSSQ